GLDLAAVAAGHFPHQVGGLGQLTIDHASFRDGRLEHAKMRLIAGSGQLSRSLAIDAVKRLGMVAPLLDRLPPRIEYQQLALALTITPRGVTIHGLCDGGVSPGTVLAGGDGAILTEPSQSQSLAALASLFAGHDAPSVPL